MKFSTWPYSSNKYLQLALIWSFIIHLILIFYIVGTPRKIQKLPNILPDIYLSKRSAPEMPLDIPDSNTVADPTVKMEKADSQNVGAAKPSMPAIISSTLPIQMEYDTPAIPATELDINDIDGLPDNVKLENPLLVIKLWIDHTGLISRTEIISTQLDEQTTKKLATKIGSQYFFPAIKDQRGVSSTKIYAIGTGHSE